MKTLQFLQFCISITVSSFALAGYFNFASEFYIVYYLHFWLNEEFLDCVFSNLKHFLKGWDKRKREGMDFFFFFLGK